MNRLYRVCCIALFSLTVLSATPTWVGYSTTEFRESALNNGSIGTTAVITLYNGETFTGTNGDEFVGLGHVVVTNLPMNLGVSIVRTSATTLTVSFTGNAVLHTSANDLYTLTFAFQNSAFTGGDAASVSSSTRGDLQLLFDKPVLSYSGTAFQESVMNDGSINPGDSVTVTLVHDTFDGVTGEDFVGNSKVTVTNVPAGFSVTVVLRSSTQATVSVTGAAAAHAAGNSVTDLNVSFASSAFTSAGYVENSERSFRIDYFTALTPGSAALDGADDYFQVAYAAAHNPAQWTYELWARVDGSPSTFRTPLCARYYDGSHVYGVNFYAGDNERWQGWASEWTQWSGLTGPTVEYGVWTHLAMTYDGVRQRFYVNGILEDSADIAFTQNTTSPLRIGANETGIYRFNGRVDEVRIWDYARSRQEIADAMHDEPDSTETGLRACYRFSEGSDSVLYDFSALRRNGEPVNGADIVGGNAGVVSPVSTTLTETYGNVGKFDSTLSLVLTISGPATFTGANDDDFAAAAKAAVTNVPAGLTAVVKRTTDTSAAVTLTGIASAHAAADSTDNLTVTFQNTAFAGGNASNVTNAVTDSLRVQFLDPVSNMLHFDGINDVVSVPASSPINLSTGSWEAWVRVTDLSDHRRVLFKAGDSDNGMYELYILSTGVFRADVYDYSVRYNVAASGVTCTPNVWYHLAATYDGTDLKLYVDGVLRGTTVVDFGPIGANNGPLGIGGSVTDPSFRMAGEIDEVRIWSTVRTDSEIANTRYNFSLSPSTAGLAALFRFDQGTAGGTNTGVTQAADATANDNNGSLLNFALTGATSNFVSSTTPLPVELASFTAAKNGRGVELRWNTASETDNLGFEVERREPLQRVSGASEQAADASMHQWNRVAFIPGHGTTNAPQSYSYIDAKASGRVEYRLKQLDRDGSFSYSQSVELDLSAPAVFELSQNHPNPFNPSTLLAFTVPVTGRTALTVYNSIGQRVATLFDGIAESGVTYERRFDGSAFASGIYITRLTSGGYSSVIKMTLMK
ncbi:MAG: hypothetical protein F9K22_06630 [Bacteroidetes bacterium]|nr:MAG: hypothetical protein F9K22_06630 [Bacteroidota bacterium]